MPPRGFRTCLVDLTWRPSPRTSGRTRPKVVRSCDLSDCEIGRGQTERTVYRGSRKLRAKALSCMQKTFYFCLERGFYKLQILLLERSAPIEAHCVVASQSMYPPPPIPPDKEPISQRATCSGKRPASSLRPKRTQPRLSSATGTGSEREEGVMSFLTCEGFSRTCNLLNESQSQGLSEGGGCCLGRKRKEELFVPDQQLFFLLEGLV